MKIVGILGCQIWKLDCFWNFVFFKEGLKPEQICNVQYMEFSVS